MKNGMFVPVTRIQSSPRVKSDGKAHVDTGTGKPTLTQQGIDVDAFIRQNHTLIENLRKGTNWKETIMTATIQEQKPQSEPEDLRAVIADRLGTLHDAMLGVMSASFDAGDKVAYAYACKLLSGEIMDLKANYSKDAK